MITYKEKLRLLGDMIQLSVIDGELHTQEYEFIKMIAEELKVKDSDLEDLFGLSLKSVIFRSEFKRIEHFYRLALLSHSDHVHHEEEEKFLMKIGVKLGLSPFAIKRVLDEMQKSPTRMLDAEKLLSIFKAQHN
ncbi:MAG: excinuclease ABC subunit B [Flavobacteriaceae bacterium]|jgi:uncharacterized tellurite resistance protein B-like protein|nr:excinuclease ABC subunit B [Flavobacteriaceae bacterium]